MTRFIILVFFVFMIFISPSYGQSERVWSELIYHQNESSMQSLWLDGGFTQRSTHLSGVVISSVFSGGTLGNDQKNEILNWERGNSLSLISGLHSNFSYRTSLNEKFRFTVNAGFSETAHARTTTDLVGLLLNGNGPYEDQQLTLGNTRMWSSGKQFLGAGIEMVDQHVVVGASLKLEKISRGQYLSISDQSQLYTAPFGTDISGFVNLEATSSDLNSSYLTAWKGTGIGVDIYASYQSEKVTLFGAIQNFGIEIFNNRNNWIINDSFLLEGTDLGSFRSFGESISEPTPENLESWINVNDTVSNNTQLAFSTIDLRTMYQINDPWSVTLQARFFPMISSATLRFTGIYQPLDWLIIEPTISIFNFSTLSPGLNATFIASEKILVSIQTEQFSNLLAPQDSHSQSVFINVGYGF